MSEIKELDKHERDIIFVCGACPDCGHQGFLEGPSGGCSTNIMCGGCGSKFNVCPPFFAERIGR